MLVLQGTFQVLFWYRSSTVLVLFKYCFSAVLVLFKYCSSTVLVLFKYCFSTVIVLFKYCRGTNYQKFNMPLHDPSWYPTCVQSFSPVPFTVFELQGLKLNNNNNNNKKNCKNELRLIFHTSPMQILSYYRQTCISDVATLWW